MHDLLSGVNCIVVLKSEIFGNSFKNFPGS